MTSKWHYGILESKNRMAEAIIKKKDPINKNLERRRGSHVLAVN